MLLALQLNNLLEDAAEIPPVFSGPIPDISRTQDTGTHQYDLSAYFTGADTYAIDPAVETGWSFDTNTGVLEIDTDALGSFGPFTVTATNANGDTPSNAFSVAVVAAQVESDVSGGWATFLNTYERQIQRRREEARKRQELEEETERIPDPVDRSIAQLLREQEALDAKRADLRSTLDLARANADIEAARRYSDRVAAALEAALKTETAKALARLEKELRKASEEEEALLLAVMLTLQ